MPPSLYWSMVIKYIAQKVLLIFATIPISHTYIWNLDNRNFPMHWDYLTRNTVIIYYLSISSRLHILFCYTISISIRWLTHEIITWFKSSESGKLPCLLYLQLCTSHMLRKCLFYFCILFWASAQLILEPLGGLCDSLSLKYLKTWRWA